MFCCLGFDVEGLMKDIEDVENYVLARFVSGNVDDVPRFVSSA